ncbi:MAG TPA: UDP-N-acetylmuramate dehydrogenase [Ferrovibrio sp.]|uniref:UDP-N-acetylmuramate dehydrogenase n=1 Tax=Ferrovibrio sp. TaxID=1917215 RepID=UPI002ED1C338
MMAEQIRQDDLLARLPAVRGRLTAQAALADITWFRVGGPAEAMFRPADRDDLIAFLKSKPADVPVTVLGVGSNTLVRDGGVPGVVIRLGREFVGIEADGEEVEAGAGALDVNVATVAQQAGIAGLEFLRGIPGTVGGGLRMNAGAYGREFKDVLVWAEALDPSGNLHRLSLADMKFGYRHCGVPENWIFLAARLRGEKGDPALIKQRMAEIQAAREGSQPIRSRTGGSTFANPEGHKAWQLIDAAGCRGLVVGDAQVSEQHCNFLINRGSATATDLETLGETVRERVKAQSGIALRWEIKRIGKPRDGAHD